MCKGWWPFHCFHRYNETRSKVNRVPARWPCTKPYDHVAYFYEKKCCRCEKIEVVYV